MEAIMDGNEKARFDSQQQALFRQWITSPSAGYVLQNPDGTPYREPQPALTDEEREALRGMLPTIMYEPHRKAIESILARLG
jgi:hypothetical protein